MKVYGGRCEIREKGINGRIIVGAYTKKQAIELAGISYHELKTYWSETRNDLELATATEAGAWVSEDVLKKEYRRIK